MSKEEIRRMEGLLSKCSSALYLTQRACLDEDFEDVKGVCELVAEVIDEVRGDLTKAYIRATA